MPELTHLTFDFLQRAQAIEERILGVGVGAVVGTGGTAGAAGAGLVWVWGFVGVVLMFVDVLLVLWWYVDAGEEEEVLVAAPAGATVASGTVIGVLT